MDNLNILLKYLVNSDDVTRIAHAAGWYVAVIVVIRLLVVVGLNWYLYKTKKQQER